MTNTKCNQTEMVKKILLEEFGIETEQQLEAEFKKMEKLNIGIFVSPIKAHQDKRNYCNAISHVNVFQLLSFIKSAAHITEQAEIRSIHQMQQDPFQLCVDLKVEGQGLYAAIVQYAPDTWIPLELLALESVTTTSVFY